MDIGILDVVATIVGGLAVAAAVLYAYTKGLRRGYILGALETTVEYGKLLDEMGRHTVEAAAEELVAKERDER